MKMSLKRLENSDGKSKAWIGVVSKSHVLRGVAGGFAQLCHGKNGPLQRMSTGDWLIYYSPSTEFQSGLPLKAFTAIGQVQQAIYSFDMGNGFVPFRRDVDYLITNQDALVKDLSVKLDFIQKNKNWGMLARRGHFEIPMSDALLIAETMGVRMTR